MDIEILTRSNHKLKKREVVKRYMFNETVKFNMYRMDNAKTPDTLGVVMMPSSTYIPRVIWMKAKEFYKDLELTDDQLSDKIMMSFETEYTYTSDLIKDFFTQNLFKDMTWRSGSQVPLISMMIFKTKLEWYFNMFGLMKDKKVIMRFWPTTDEKRLLLDLLKEGFEIESPLGRLDRGVKILDMLEKVSMVHMNFDRLCDIYYNKKKKWKKPLELFKEGEDYMTTITNTIAGELTMHKVDYFNRARHEVFMKVVVSLMGEDPPDQSDVDLTSTLGYTGPMYFQTPDYIYQTSDKLVILDFAVTGADPGMIRDKKIKKYHDLAINLEGFIGKPVEVEAVVWKINSVDNFFIPPELNISSRSIWEDKSIKMLRSLYLEMAKKDKFNFYKKNILEEKEEEEYEDIIHLVQKELQDLIKNKLNCMDLIVKAIPIENSRKEMGFWQRVDQKKVEPKEMEYYKMLETIEEEGVEDYIEKVSELYVNMVQTGRMPKYQEKFLSLDLDKVKEVSENIIQEAGTQRALYLSGEGKEPRKVPTMLPFPILSRDNQMDHCDYLGGLGKYKLDYEYLLEDGTMLVKSDLDFSLKHSQEMDKKENQLYCGDGLGFDVEEDVDKVEDLVEFLMEEEMWHDKTGKWGGFPQEDKMQGLYNTKLWKVVDFFSDLAENLCYLEGRRFYKMNTKDKKSLGYTVCKSFKDYVLILKRGSRLTKEKQIRFKIITTTKNLMTSNNLDFKAMNLKEDETGIAESDWLTVSSPMLKHYLKMREVTALLYSSLMDKTNEANRGKIHEEYKLDKTFTTMVLIMMEGKRGTSTTAQINRYLLHSATSYITNREELMKDIMGDPIRTRIEAYLRVLQIKWYNKMLSDSEDMWKQRLSTMLSNNNDYDRFHTWSPYDLEVKIEFNIMMDCIYVCNLFEKGVGFIEHRVKAIMSKMVKAERHYLKVRHKMESKGVIKNLVEFWNTEDELHMFDNKWYMSATKRFFKKKAHKLEINLAVEEAMAETANTAMMMTASVTSGPLPCKTLKYSKEVMKTKSFLSIFEEVEELNTNNLLELVSKNKEVEAIFSLFPKAQIGGPREILIMSVRLRLMVKFLEMFSEKICKIHPKEMLTKDRMKSQMQSDYANTIREEQKEMTKKNINSVSMFFNMDASKWSPGFVLEQFYTMAFSMDIPQKIKDILLAITSAFSCKFMFTPEALKKKWLEKSTDIKEDREDLEWFRIKGLEQGMVVEILSGMGQGMLHRMSSLMGCLADDASDEVAEYTVSKLHNVKIIGYTLLSSDDKTKFLMFYGNVPNEILNEAINSYARVWDSTTRLANIHINWKKSGMNFIIAEFNSLFSIGRRTVWASVKDVYNTFNIPDLTWPENAVQEMMGNLRRCLEHGLFMTSIKLASKMINSQLRRYYRIDNLLVIKLINMLDTTEDRLPFHLGFFPTSNLISKLVMGKEVMMFSSNNSKKLNSFYKKMYSAQRNKLDQSMKTFIPFTEDSRGRFWMMINMKMDKALKEMKKEFFSNKLRMDSNSIMKEMNKMTLNINLPMNDWKSHKKFVMEYFLGMNRSYEFNDTMAIHSLVRALQFSAKKAVIMPKSLRLLKMEERINLLEEKIKFKDWLFEEDMDSIMEERDKLYKEMDESKVDLLDFTNHVMLTGEEETSCLGLYNSLAGLEDSEEEFEKEMDPYPMSFKYLHSTIKRIRFYISPSGLSVSGKELLTHLFEEKHPSSNRLISTTLELFKRGKWDKMSQNLLYSNPFKTIKELMSGSNLPFKDFYDYMKDTFKNMKFMEMTLVSDFSCSGNFLDNMKKLMMTRGDPSYIKVFPSDKYTQDQESLKFLTNISLARYSDIELLDVGESVNMLHRDTKLKRAQNMYMASKASKNGLFLNKNVVSDRVEYKKTISLKKDQITHFWTDYRMVIVAKEFETNVNFYILSSYDLDEDEYQSQRLMNIFEKFMTDMKSARKRLSNMTLESWSMVMSMTYTRMDFELKTQIQRLFSKWRIMLYLLPLKDSSLSKALDSTFTNLILFEDQYTADFETMMTMRLESGSEEFYTLRSMNSDVPDIETLDRILVKYDLLPEINMPLASKKEDTDSHLDIQEILKQFNESAGAVGMISNLTKMLKASQLNKMSEESSDSEEEEVKEKMDLKEEEMLEGFQEELNISPISINKGKALFSMNSMVEGMRMMKERFVHEEEADFEEEAVFDDLREGKRMRRIKMADLTTNLINKSLMTGLDYDKRKMRKIFESFRRNGNEVGFHNLLLLQINSCFDFSISDSMSMYIYNQLLTKMSTVILVKPTYKVVKFGPDKTSLLKDNMVFLSKKEEMDDNLSDIIQEF